LKLLIILMGEEVIKNRVLILCSNIFWGIVNV